MAYLTPTETLTIPVHPNTEGSLRKHRLAVEKHVFQAPQQPAERSIAYLWSHADGFHKETLHPLMRRCLSTIIFLPEFKRTNITFVAFDARNQGDSARLNEADVNIPTYGWLDNALDTIQVIEALDLRKSQSKVIGVGHSFGGSSMIIAEFLYPNTFDGLCILEAVVRKESVPRHIWINFPSIKMTLKRRDTWPNREACLRSFDGRPFWKDLHPEALQNYVNYGLYDAPDGTVKLKCPKEEEYLVYLAGQIGSTITYHGLKTVTIPVHMVHAKSSTFTDAATAPIIKNLSPSITSATVEGSHTVVLETPDILIPEIVQLTQRVLASRAKL